MGLAFSGMVHHNLVVKGPLFPLIPDGWAGPQGSWQVQSFMGYIGGVEPESLIHEVSSVMDSVMDRRQRDSQPGMNRVSSNVNAFRSLLSEFRVPPRGFSLMAVCQIVWRLCSRAFLTYE